MKIGAFGEVMLRLSPPDFLLLEQTEQLRMDFTGTGLNILGNLAHFGVETFLLTSLPKNRIGDAARGNIRKLGVSDEYIVQKGHHIGSYFAENGFGARPTYVTYQNRHSSAFGKTPLTNYDVEKILSKIDCLHICGISLSLSENTRNCALQFAKAAHEQGKFVCFDFNYRPSLNQENTDMKEVYEKILPYCDFVFGSQRDLTELLGLAGNPEEEAEQQMAAVITTFLKKYQIKLFAGTTRKQEGQRKSLQGYLYTPEEVFFSKDYELQFLDRIGTGDAFAAGILLGIAEGWNCKNSVEFATANGVLAHTIYGDVPLTTKEQVLAVIKNSGVEIIR